MKNFIYIIIVLVSIISSFYFYNKKPVYITVQNILKLSVFDDEIKIKKFKIYKKNEDWYNSSLWKPLDNCFCFAHYSSLVDNNRIKFSCTENFLSTTKITSIYLDLRFNNSLNKAIKTTNICKINESLLWIEYK